MITYKHFLRTSFLFITLVGCGEQQGKEKISTAPIEFQKEGELVIYSSSGDTLRQIDIEIADDDYERETGLMYRKSLQTDQGMLFIFPEEQPRGFYMKNTLIPLDLLFLDSKGKVVNIANNAIPESVETIPSEDPAQYVLEIRGGLAEQWGLKVGDSIGFTRQDP